MNDCLGLTPFWLDYDGLHSGLSVFWSELRLAWTMTCFIRIWTASYIAYQYSRNHLLTPQQCVGFQESISVETLFIFISQETCSVTSWFPRIYLCRNTFHFHIPGNVFRNKLVSKNPSLRKRVRHSLASNGSHVTIWTLAFKARSEFSMDKMMWYIWKCWEQLKMLVFTSPLWTEKSQMLVDPQYF
jgi:hypothetical protein